MFWADQILKDRSGDEWVNDASTPSGIVHMGSLKGPVIHDVINKVLKEKGTKTKYTFGFDDMDAIDGLPSELLKTHEKYMGIPIAYAPGPDGTSTFGEYFGNMMRDLFEKLGIEAEIYLASDYYKKGIYNKTIEYVLNNADKVRKVYSEMYKKEIAQNWYPLQVVCPYCGKVGTTEVTGWDGKEVSFACREDKVKWAKGCGFSGKISPFDGNTTMPFKVEWAAKWWTFGITIEGAGKDHASAGGTYDVARKIVKDVFGKEPPLKLPYEFFLYDGKKMSSSKGLGLTGQQLLEVLPAQLVRFLMIKTPPNQAVEFNPRGTLIIPNLYDEYQKAKDSTEDYIKRAYEFSRIGGEDFPVKSRFLTLAQWVQMPNMEEEIKKEGLEELAKYARVWVEKYAPDSEKFEIKKEITEDMKKLSDEQKKYLGKVSEELDKDWDGEEFQTKLYEWSKEMGISSKDAFNSIYATLIGKNSGPKAGWLVLKYKELSKKRFEEISES